MKKTVNIIRIASDDSWTDSPKDIVTCNDKLGFAYPMFINSKAKDTCKKQHLYFVTREEIKDGDWFYNNNHNKVFQNKYPGIPQQSFKSEGGLHKIVATTDKSLGLPLINHRFLEFYIEKQGIIEKVTYYDELNTVAVIWDAILFSFTDTPIKKQQTVEEAALEQYHNVFGVDDKGNNPVVKLHFINSFVAGANWQKQQQ